MEIKTMCKNEKSLQRRRDRSENFYVQYNNIILFRFTRVIRYNGICNIFSEYILVFIQLNFVFFKYIIYDSQILCELYPVQPTRFLDVCFCKFGT